MQQHSNVKPLISSPLVLRCGKTSILVGAALFFLVQCGDSKQLCEDSPEVWTESALCVPGWLTVAVPVSPAAMVCCALPQFPHVSYKDGVL